MVGHPVSIVPATDELLAEVALLSHKQQNRHYTLNSALPPPGSSEETRQILTAAMKESALVALNAQGRVRGYAQPAVWTLKETSILLSFLTARNGIVEYLTLPDPTDDDAAVVATALLNTICAFWRTAQTTGDLIRWPSSDTCLEDQFTHHGFQLDSICAFRPHHPFFPSRWVGSPDIHIRSAQPEDENTLVELFQEELHFHEDYTPFVRSSPQVLDAFRRKLHHLWASKDDAPIVLVAEQAGEIVGMAENTLITIESGEQPGFTPAGRYWCINNVSIHKNYQGQGIGKCLVQAIEDASLALDIAGYLLWFNPPNPRATRFWTGLGFKALWTTYQRLHSS